MLKPSEVIISFKWPQEAVDELFQHAAIGKNMQFDLFLCFFGYLEPVLKENQPSEC